MTVQSMVHISGYIKDTSQDRLPSRMRRNLALYSLDVTELLARRDVCFMYCRHRQAKAINLHWREIISCCRNEAKSLQCYEIKIMQRSLYNVEYTGMFSCEEPTFVARCT